MRNMWLVSAIVCAFAIPGSALATVYDFRSTEMSALGNPAFSFVLDTSKAAYDMGVTTFTGVTITQDGVPSAGDSVFIPDTTDIGSPLFFFIDTDVPVTKAFDSGAGTGITFNAGTYSIADGAKDGEGTLTISAAPEPTTWALMIAGVGMIGAALRFGRRSGSPATG